MISDTCGQEGGVFDVPQTFADVFYRRPPMFISKFKKMMIKKRKWQSFDKQKEIAVTYLKIIISANAT